MDWTSRLTPGRLHRQRGRRWLVALLLPVLAARLLVPQGFMPGGGAGHGLSLQMCHGAGPLPAGIERTAGVGSGEPGSYTPHDAPRFDPSPPQRPLHHPHSPRAPPSVV
jgi:hypothetical protein